jgi:hypothetical protein
VSPAAKKEVVYGSKTYILNASGMRFCELNGTPVNSTILLNELKENEGCVNIILNNSGRLMFNIKGNDLATVMHGKNTTDADDTQEIIGCKMKVMNLEELKITTPNSLTGMKLVAIQ